MAPPRPRRSPTTLPAPALMVQELVEEILLRIPPDEPADLFRAAVVCKPWRRIISDPGFLRRYRAFHRRRPPLLGFFFNDWSQLAGGRRPSFKTTAAAFPSLPTHYRRRARRVLDCRHGRVLLEERRSKNKNLIVWDPISDDASHELQVHDDIDCNSYILAVLCAVSGCDHHDCHGGPFLVVCLGGAQRATVHGTVVVFKVLVYSSEAHAWGEPVSSQFNGVGDLAVHDDRVVVIGDEIYCVFTRPGVSIVKYDLIRRCTSLVSSPPPIVVDPVLTQNRDGSLGLASIRHSRLYLWSLSRTVHHDGKLVADWVQERVIQLGKILPTDIYEHYSEVYVAGFAEGVGILFISTDVGTFMFEPKSGRVRNITLSKDFTAFPFISLFTPSPSEATGRAAISAEPAIKKLYVESPLI